MTINDLTRATIASALRHESCHVRFVQVTAFAEETCPSQAYPDAEVLGVAP